MSYIKFDKEQLVNLRFALKREFIRTNRAGAFATSTIIGCNTRKYHGLFIVPQPDIDGGNHVLLSTIDETIIQQNEEFHMGIHCYPDGVLNPKGHKYISGLEMEPMPKFTYRVGGVIFTKEIMFCIESDRLLIKYTLEDAHSPTVIRLQPFLAFRNIHALTKANPNADTHAEPVENGIKIRMYPGYSTLFLQCSKKIQYTHVPHWNYNIEYVEEKERGYDYQEDVFVPGYFELPMSKGESVVFTAGLNEIDGSKLKQIYSSETKKRIPRDNYKNCLINSGLQFFVTRNNKVEIIAGYPWFGRWGRDTFIALPGLTLAINDPEKCKAIIDNMIAELKGGLLPNVGCGQNSAYNSVDAPLWFFWALQQYAIYTGTQSMIWKEYGEKMKLILNAYRNGCEYNIKMQDNGLIYAGIEGKALTWMDAIVDGKPVTPRIGLAVEINALWYNAVKFAIEVAKLAGDQDFAKEWDEIACKIPAAFKGTFWNKDKGYLCDYVNGDYKDWSVRPNQLLAASLPYSPVSEQIRELILEITERELLTRRGIRTLSPKSPDYKGIYKGGIHERDAAYHQGIAWPWLLGHYAEAYLKIHPNYGLPHIKQLYESFEPVMMEHGIGTISELYDGDPPYLPGGAPSQAWSVAELLRIDYLIEKYSSVK
ncbi:MAG: glycogen debranching enzyme family protein [Bacteroidales bacterium]|nr:glycogen debranching enzyme family protein [Bacteroidales bacterium]HNZ43560.1 amylo-alpha-1,6-glucosidase [Bacteroidales bacterium]